MQYFFVYLRYGFRMALRQPGVTLSIIALLALGMGGVTAIFNPIYSTLFSPLPFPQPERLVRVGGRIPLFDGSNGSFRNEEILGRIFSHITAYSSERTKIIIPDIDRQVEVTGLVVSEYFFKTLDVKPVIGRDCTDRESRNGLVVSHRFWRNELKEKTDAVGTPVLLPGTVRRFPIIGIMPESFNFPIDTDIWLCNNDRWYGFSDPGLNAHFVGRLHPGTTYEQAAKELQSNFQPVNMSTFSTFSTISSDGPLLQPLQIAIYGDQKPLLRMLGSAAFLFLLLVCAGVLNLLITQGMKRKQEIATRLIHGATRRNLVFQLLVETLPLVVTGGLAGWWLSEVVSAWLWAQLPALRGGAVGVPVKMAFWASLALMVTLVGGLIPSLYATGLDLNTYLKSASAGGKRSFFSSREFLVGVQLCVALALLIGVGVLLRSIMFNVDTPIGWSSHDMAVVSLNPTVIRPPELQPGGVITGDMVRENSRRYAALNQDIHRELIAMPEVISAEYLSPIPFSAEAVRESFTGRLVSKTPGLNLSSGELITAMTATVSAGGFDILDIPLVAGRNFTEADANARQEGGVSAGGVAIINQALARQLWPEENNVIGKAFYDNSASLEVVGVVRNYHHVPGKKDFIPTIYFPYTVVSAREINILVKLRANTSFQDFHASARQRLSGFAVDWIEAQPFSERLKYVTANQRLTLQLLGCFAVLGVVVSGLAVYATASLMVTARKREIGIRMAMGAQPLDILKFVIWSGMRAILIGLPFGLLLALLLSRALSSYLVYVTVGDPPVWLTCCAALLVITTVASLIPALQALRINPVDVMRGE